MSSAIRTDSASSETESEQFDRAVALIRRELRGVPITTSRATGQRIPRDTKGTDDDSLPAAGRRA